MGNKIYLMGVDVGSTNIKSAIFDLTGNEIAIAVKRLSPGHPFPGWAERDMETMWYYTADVIRESIKLSKVDPSKIIGLSVSGHGDGLYCLDRDCTPVRKGILSIDVRSAPLLKKWESSGVYDELFPIILQKPHAGAPISLLAWLKEKEKKSYDDIRWIIFCKDYIKYKLTGVVCTDETDPSATLTDIRKRRPDDKIFEILNLDECKGKVPEIIPGWKICGEITNKISKLTGLKKGTPVTSGLHDIDATGLGSGCAEQGQLLIILGTWEINQIVLDRITIDPAKTCITRVYGTPDRWILINSSPAAAANLNWFIDQLGREECLSAQSQSISVYAYSDKEIEQIPIGSEEIIYHPFLHGQIGNPNATAGFYGITGKHTRAHLLRSVYEGIAYSTYMQVKQLREVVKVKEIRIAGGGSKSRIWTKILTDVMNLPIKVPKGSELGARGAALCAGVGVGVFKDHRSALEEFTSIVYEQIPDKEDVKKYFKFYQLFEKSIKQAEVIWNGLETIRSTQ